MEKFQNSFHKARFTAFTYVMQNCTCFFSTFFVLF